MADKKPLVPNRVVKCPLCLGYFPVLEGSDGKQVVVQPFPVGVVAPFRGHIHTTKPMSQGRALEKAIEGTMTVRTLPPVFVPHVFCCLGGEEIPSIMKPLPDPEGDPNEEENVTESEDSSPPENPQDDQPTPGDDTLRVHETRPEDFRAEKVGALDFLSHGKPPVG